MFNARAASVVERVLSISLSIVPLDRARWVAAEALPGRSGDCCRVLRMDRVLATLASLGDKRSGATHDRGHRRMSCEELDYLRR